jgi:hypothetical protein
MPRALANSEAKNRKWRPGVNKTCAKFETSLSGTFSDESDLVFGGKRPNATSEWKTAGNQITLSVRWRPANHSLQIVE